MNLQKWLKLKLSKDKALDLVDSYKKNLQNADTARDENNWAEAAYCYQIALSLNSKAEHLHIQLGHMLKESGDFINSKIEYDKYASIYPNDAEIHLQLGHLLNKQDKTTEALDKYKLAKTLAPSNQEISKHIKNLESQQNFGLDRNLRNKALLCTDLKKWDEAYALLTILVDIKKHTDLNTILGNVCKEKGDFTEAFKRYQSSLNHALAKNNLPALIDTHMQIGHFFKIDHKPIEALKNFIAAKNISFKNGLDNYYEDSYKEIRSVRREISMHLD